MAFYASVSFGKDSLAMLLLLLEKKMPLDEVIFYNSGMEFQAIYDIRDRMKPILEQRGVRFTEVEPDVPFLYNMLERPVDSQKNGFHLGYGWCGGPCRWGTSMKTRTLDGVALDAEVHYVGIAADETERLMKLEAPKRSPLANAGMTEADCLAFCYERGFFWEEKEGFDLPKSVQDAIPIRRLWPDGIFQFGSKFSKTIRFTDINYAIASKEDKTSMFLGYSELLNALDTGSTTKITINNKRLNRQNFEQEILIPRQDDYLDGYRAEYNSMLMDKVTDSSNSVVQERYVTLSVHRKNVEEARAFFDRVTADVTTRLSHLDAHSEELDAVERLRVLHDFYRTGEEAEYHLDLRDLMRKGHSFKDSICPDSLEFKKDHFIMGGKFGRVLFLKEYASYIKDSMISELTALNRTMMLSIDVIPVPTDEAVREMQNRLLGVETNVTNWQRRQNNNNNFSAVVPYDLEQQRKETREMLDDLTTRDQRMMFAVVTLVHLADSKEELDSDTETLQSAARKHLCQLATLNWQQADGLTTALSLSLRRIDTLRTLTTEALAVLMPFKAQEIRGQGGIYYGQNVISKNLIVANRKELLNGNGFVLGVSGSGKSFTAKEEIAWVALSTEDDIIVIDPESEYGPLIEGLGGEVVNISATSRNHINAMDMEQGYGDGENPVVLKSEFLLSLCEQLVGSGKLSAKEKSIIDRCTAGVYHDYIRSGYRGAAPTLQDFHAELLRQSEAEARDVALAIELFTEGSLNTFSRLLGHANPSITMDKYGHALDDHKRISIGKLGDVYAGAKKRPALKKGRER